MAKFNVVGLEGLTDDLKKDADRAERLAPKLLKIGAEVIAKAQRQEADAMISSGKIRMFGNDSRSTGAFKASIKPTPIRGSGAGAYVDVYPQGKDHKGVRNAEKGFIAEYGTKKQPAYPWMSTANEKAMPEAIKKMQAEWEKED